MKNMRVFSILFVLFLTLSSHIVAIGAGIVPYCKHHSGEIYFLLGEDHHRKGVWTDFGGAADHLEGFADAAAREGHEETMGVFSGTSDDPKNKSHQGTRFFRNRINAQTPHVRHRKNGYRTYFVDVTAQVRNIKKKAKAASGRQAVIQKLKNTRQQVLKKKGGWRCFKEKVNFKWVTFAELQNQTVTLYRFFASSLRSSQFGNPRYGLNKSAF